MLEVYEKELSVEELFYFVVFNLIVALQCKMCLSLTTPQLFFKSFIIIYGFRRILSALFKIPDLQMLYFFMRQFFGIRQQTNIKFESLRWKAKILKNVNLAQVSRIKVQFQRIKNLVLRTGSTVLASLRTIYQAI